MTAAAAIAAAAAAAVQVEKHAKEALRSGLCVVIGLQCTGEAANERAASRAADDDEEGDPEFSELCCPAQDSAPPLRLPASRADPPAVTARQPLLRSCGWCWSARR